MLKSQLLNIRLASLTLATCAAVFVGPARAQTQGAQSPQDWAQVRTVLDQRCVVCHSCYDAPCQLKLTSPAGLLRGASKQSVYNAERLSDSDPTRLGFDADDTAGWRALGFHAVTDPSGSEDEQISVLEQYLDLGRQNPLPEDEPIPDQLGLAIDRPLVCPTPQEFETFRKDHPLAGMPYATAPLSNNEYALLKSWIGRGTPLPAAEPDIPEDIRDQIAAWEAFLNQPDPRSQLAARYLYEHLFLARLHFPGDAPRRFFEVVRSTTPPGEDIDVIATRRPFDSPGAAPFYYRLRLIGETIVHKEHLVYPLGPDRMSRFRQLFLDTDWDLSELPAYGEAEGGNPFNTFAAIPARSRYEFMLDDALFFVRSFIRGPVCHGQTAVDVIEDRFWVSFLDPDADLSITDPGFLDRGTVHLELPVSKADQQTLSDLQTFSHKHQARYLEFRDAQYKDSPAHQDGFDYDAIWDGDGTNPNALITVFRHFDSASAMTGFHGGIPETGWVIDYPVFERIYYNLVAGFDVFGRVEHQLSTRLYMDELRMESEDNFLRFMPRDIRQQMHAGWYQGTLAEVHTYWHRRRVDDRFPDGIDYESPNPKQEFLLALLDRGNGLWAVSDPINRCDDCGSVQGDIVETQLRDLADQQGPWVRFLPDLTLLLVDRKAGGTDLFSLAHDKAHYNVAFLFGEANRRDPDSDVLTILPGVIGSYTNFYLTVPEEQLNALVAALKSMRTQQDWMQVVADFGVRRTSSDFWPVSDKVQSIFHQQQPVQAGILDLNRYKDPKAGDDPT